MKKITLLTVFLLCFTGTSNAQLFKKIGKKIENAAEKTLERKVEQKATKETEKAFDSTFNKKRGNKTKTSLPGFSKVEPAEGYTFKHKVEMQMKTGKDLMNLNYYLPSSGDYFGMAVKDEKIKGDFMMVYDINREAMFTFMESGGHKMKMGISFKTDDIDTEDLVYEIRATGNTKTILGYNCKEYKMNGKDMTATIWVTKEVDIRFPSTLYSTDKNKNNNQEWMKDLDGWAMEMIMINTAEKKPQTITMNCLSINKSSLEINSSDYQSMGY
ncbi:MAG: hypothetical protein COA67_10110 [Lutibacter sp.]|nr:MAG: hypothetical protein COA67_10110 [Lutibacter sp.]